MLNNALFEIYPSSGLTDVPGFKCAATACDIRFQNNQRLDLAVVYSELPCNVGAVFTQSKIVAAPVMLSKEILQQKEFVRAIVVNSGNANACNGDQGGRDARKMVEISHQKLNLDEKESVLVCSTGRIGRPLPMEKIKRGLISTCQQLKNTQEAGKEAAMAILTSDTREKMVSVRFNYQGSIIFMSGIAKGAGMIQPNMATMLAFIATNVRIENSLFQDLLEKSVEKSFNAISVDGDTSTNDSVIALSNGQSNVVVLPEDDLLLKKFRSALDYITTKLAEEIVSDGERISKVVSITVEGGESDHNAEKVARSIGNSLLVKTSWHGNDPNWGRILAAAGYAGVDIQENKIDLFYESFKGLGVEKAVPVMESGKALPKNQGGWSRIVKEPRFGILLKLNAGLGKFQLLANDLTEGYVSFNKNE